MLRPSMKVQARATAMSASAARGLEQGRRNMDIRCLFLQRDELIGVETGCKLGQVLPSSSALKQRPFSLAVGITEFDAQQKTVKL